MCWACCGCLETAHAAQVRYFKQLLLYCVAGVDRGFAANDRANEEVERAVSSLQNATTPVVLSWTSGTAPLLASSAARQPGTRSTGAAFRRVCAAGSG